MGMGGGVLVAGGERLGKIDRASRSIRETDGASFIVWFPSFFDIHAILLRRAVTGKRSCGVGGHDLGAGDEFRALWAEGFGFLDLFDKPRHRQITALHLGDQ